MMAKGALPGNPAASRIATDVRNITMILLMLILSLIGTMATIMVSGVTNSASRDFARLYSTEAVGKFNSHLSEVIILLRKVSRSKAVIDWFADERNPEKRIAAYNEMMEYAYLLQNADLYFGIYGSLNEFLIDSTTAIGDFVPGSRLDPSDPMDAWYFDCINSDDDYVLNIDIAKYSQRWLLWINHKVMDGDNIVGVFCTGLNIEAVFHDMFSLYDSDNVRGYVINKRGIIQIDSALYDIFTGEDDSHIHDEIADPVFVNAIDAYLQRIDGYFSPNDQPEIIRLSGRTYGYASIAPIARSDWSTVIFFNNSSLFSVMHLLPLLVVMLSVFIVYTLGNIVLIQRVVLRPLNRLTKSLSVTKSSTGEIFGKDRADEIGELARTIWDMRDRLNTYNLNMLQATRELERRDQLLHEINRLAEVLLSSIDDEDFESSLQEGMESMANCMGIDCIRIWKNVMKDGVLCLSHQYRWLSPAGQQGRPVVSGVCYPYGDNVEWYEEFVKGNCINGPLSSMSEHTQELLRPRKVMSTLMIPVRLHERLWGFVSFDDCQRERRFTDEEVNILRSGSLMMVSAVNRYSQAVNIREAHKRVQLMLDAMPLCCSLWNKNLNNILCNEAAARLYNLKNKQEYLDRFFELSPEYQPDGSSSSEAALEKVKKAFEDGLYVFEWMHQLLDGTPVPCEITLVRVSYGGEYVVAAYTRDLRAYKRMMQGIELRDNLLQTVNKVADILLRSELDEFVANLWHCMGMMAKAVEADRVYIWKNHFKDDELCCTQLYEWSEGAQPQQGNEYTVDISYNETMPNWEDTLAIGRSINSLVRNMSAAEQSQLLPQGVLSILMVPVFIQDSFWGFVGFDDCHREREFSENEEAILRSASLLIANALLRNEMTIGIRDTAARLEAVISNYSGIIWNVNKDNVITLFNGLYLDRLGIMPSSMEGRTIDAAQKEFPGMTLAENVRKTFAEGPQNWITESADRVFRVHTSPIFDNHGTKTGVVGSMDDITDMIRLQKELEIALEKAQAASRAKTNFLSNMSHEIRTPMNAIIGMTTIGKTTSDLEKKDFAFEKIEGASIHLLGLINDILEMAKIEAGRFEISVAEFNLEKLVGKVVGLTTFRMNEKRQKFTMHLAEDIPLFLLGDEQRLAQVITNLLSNAVKFTPEEGSIRLDAFLEKEENGICTIKMEIEDTGIGVSKEQQARLFISFEQAENSTSRKFGGSGLGLTIAKHIVEMMGGNIWLESELGKGSTFFFTVQVRRSEKAATGLLSTTAATGAADDQAESFAEYRLLLAEDVEINREIVLTMLEEIEIGVDCAENGVKALEMFSADPEHYDLIFMDMQMPEMDGLEATRRIRKLAVPKASDIPIVAMTANVFKEDIEKCLEAGMNDHVGKPLDFGEVMNKLRQYLKHKN